VSTHSGQSSPEQTGKAAETQDRSARRWPVTLTVILVLVLLVMAGGLGFLGWKTNQMAEQVQLVAAVATSTTSADLTTGTTVSTTVDPWKGRYGEYQQLLLWFIDKRDNLWQDIYDHKSNDLRGQLTLRLLWLHASADGLFLDAPDEVRKLQYAYVSNFGALFSIANQGREALLASEEWRAEVGLLRAWQTAIGRSR